MAQLPKELAEALEQLRVAQKQVADLSNDKNSQNTALADEDFAKMLVEAEKSLNILAEDIKSGKLRGGNTSMLPKKK